MATLRASIDYLGKRHVQWLLADWPRRPEAAWRGAWAANHMPNWHAYAALLDAGPAAVQAVINK